MNYAFSLNREPERQLLLHIARTTLESEQVVAIKELLTLVDWAIVIPLAASHGMLPLLYHHLKEEQDFCDRVPTEVLLKIKERCTLIARQNLALIGDLFKVSQLLASHGIATMAYKGPTLAHTAYGNVGLRPFLDIDILVRPHDSLEAHRILRCNGYDVGHDLPDDLLKRLWSNRYSHVFDPEEGHGGIEMHWSLIAPRVGRSLNITEAWERRVPSSLSSEIYALSREDLVIALCIHGAKHEWSRLEWICCLAQIIRPKDSQDELDWPLLYSLARRYGCNNIVGLGTDLAGDLLKESGHVLPCELRDVCEQNRQASSNSLRQHIWKTIFQEQRSAGLKVSLRQTIRYWKMQDRFTDGLNARWQMWKFLWSPIETDYGRASLPSCLYPLYTVFMLQRRVSKFINWKSKRTLSQD